MKRLALAALLLAATGARAEEPATSCTICHSNATLFDAEHVKIVEQVRAGAHGGAGLSCHDCHGGNPDPKLAEDMAAAMDPADRAHPFRAAPAPRDIPGFCGRCHSDPKYMRKFVPGARVDQEKEYWTSRHGERLAAGDKKVATCVSCHGVHGIVGPRATSSPVFPKNVAETCRRCHADPAHMAGYVLPDGRPLPVDQYARWRRSVHAEALLDKDDLSAPTCNDCHGNHGAVPPGVESIAFVCGNCHGREARLFRDSAKAAAFRDHAQYMEGAGAQGCAACHEKPKLGTDLHRPFSFAECTTCHGNHGITRPTVAMLSPLPETPCVYCHEGPLQDSLRAARRISQHYQEVREGLLEEAQAQGLSGNRRFDWLVDQLRELPFHTTEGNGQRRLRPEFARLFAKFRIGKTSYTFVDPRTQKTVRATVLGCADCHDEKPTLTDQGKGFAVSRQLTAWMRDLTSRTASAERLLLAARRGGVETRQVVAQIDQAVQAEIEMAVLVHTFSSADNGEFRTTVEKGLQHADAARDGASAALMELTHRRRGLALSLVAILMVLIGLGLKIRQLSERERGHGAGAVGDGGTSQPPDARES